MILKFLVLAFIALMCIMEPVSAGNNIWWTDTLGNNITSAEAGDTVYFQFLTVGSGGHNATPPPYDYYTILLMKQNSQSGTFIYDDNMIPSFNTRMIDDVNGSYFNFSARHYAISPEVSFRYYSPAGSNEHIYPSYFYPFYVGGNGQTCNVFGNPEEPFGGSYHTWRGYGEFVIPDDTTLSAYRAELRGYSFPFRWDNFLCNNWTSYYTTQDSSTLTVSKHWDIFSGFGSLMNDIGGDGLRYLIGVIIILVLAMIPFFVLHRLNLYITMIMIICGVGINYVTGLFDLPVVFALAIGSLAIFLLINKSSQGGQ